MEVQPLRSWAPAPAAAAEQLLRRAGVPGVLTAADSTTVKTGGDFLGFFLCTTCIFNNAALPDFTDRVATL